ncbi:unnamed protein product [Hyaloperonospora brassicae]|uniref:Uncharacterized protein n=1 Tax=Hyaloperonospora brassicae TaxID=162125 RepID=A0AAV0TBG6_HYABA|nr:unnamed protein product [Hyaloperonospora brassicae]
MYARRDPNELAHLLKVVHGVYRAHQEETALAEIMEEMQRFDTHPLAVLRMIIPIYKDVGNSERPSADIVFEQLKEYIKMYNAKRPDEPPIAMLLTLFEGFGNLARLKSFLSDVKPNPNYAQEVNRMEQLLAEFQMRLVNMFDALALEVGIAPQGQRFLANHNMESFMTYIWRIINLLPPGRQNIFAELKVMSEANPAAI